MWSKFEKIDWKKISLYIFLSTLLISSVVFICNALFKDAIDFYLPKIFIYIINIIFFLVVFYLYQDRWEKKIKSFKHFILLEKITKYIFLGSLLIITFISFENFLTQWQDKIIISNIISFVAIIKSWQIFLTIIAIISGFFTFFVNREKVEKKIEKEKINEEKAEEKRYNEFENKFPKINKIWGLKNILRLIHKNKLNILMLCGIVVLGFMLRIWNLDFLSPVRDEYYHLVAAKRFMIENTFNYSRASFLTYLIGFLFKINGEISIFLARLLSVIIGTISIILIYFLGKQYSKLAGLLSAFLLATCPLAIGMSRYIREYEYYAFFALLLTFISIKINKMLIKEKYKTFLFIALNFFLVYYYFFIERALIFMEILFFIWIIFIINSLSNIKLNFKKNSFKKIVSLKKIIISIIIICIASLALNYFSNVYSGFLDKNTTLKNERYYIQMFFNPQWKYRDGAINLFWFSNFSIHWIYLSSLFFLPILFLKKNKKKYYFIFVIIFLSVILGLSYLTSQHFASRYTYIVSWSYILMVGISLSIFFNYIFIVYRKKISYLMLIIFLLFCLINSVNGITDEKNGTFDSKTELLHYDIYSLFNFINDNNFDINETIITSNPMVFLYHFDYKFTSNDSNILRRYDYEKNVILPSNNFKKDYGSPYVYYYTIGYIHKCRDQNCNKSEKNRISEIINKNNKGWLIIDKDRNRNWNKNGFPIKNFILGNKNILYLDSTKGYRGFDIYKWKKF